MKVWANTNRKPVAIELGVATQRPTKVRVIAVDPLKKGAIYMDRVKTVEGQQDFGINLPQSPERLLIMVQSAVSDSNDIRITKLEKSQLPSYAPCIKAGKIKSFLKFAKEFSENAGILEVGRYSSDNGKYIIDYLPVIKDRGRVISTPARISNSTGRMEISKAAYSKMTIPMRMAILCHEFSHFYMNDVQKDEIEADLNALKLYLGCGYPIIEAHKAFLETFKKSPSAQNAERYEYLKTFIDNWENMKYEICLT
tara:strand:- start:1654 stop:2415 length:762 start_codon:yes stop_codon:yes gene_type:complete